jgi:hypothetical protein
LPRRLSHRANAAETVGAPRLCVLTGPDTGRSVPVPSPPSRLLVGRGERCQLRLDDDGVAEEHVEVVRDLDGVMIRTLERGVRLQINGQAVEQKRLRDADELVLGATRLLFEEPAEEPIDSLAAETDRTLPPPSPPAAPDSKPSAEVASAQPSAAPVLPPRVRTGHPSWDADLLIYALAAIVIALSIAGLVALMSAE